MSTDGGELPEIGSSHLRAPWGDESRLPPLPKHTQAQAQHFRTIKGLQKGADPEFDAFVEQKRREAYFEEFDQRVERAYLTALKGHKTEIWNAAKRRLATAGTKYTPDTLVEVNRMIDARTKWLRDVFAQIDSDYRSNDPKRQESAARDIGAALQGSPADFMAYAYERKAAARTKGTKGRMDEAVEDEMADLPDISEEEATRYMTLRPRMATVEMALKDRFGLAGARHWDALQAQKDAEYVDKLDRAAEKYKELLEQQDAHNETRANDNPRRLIARVHQGQVRFQTALEMEEERMRMMEARAQMDTERYEQAKSRRKVALQRAASWRDEGVPEAEIAARLKAQAFDRVVERQNVVAAAAKSRVVERKRAFTTLIDELEARFEERDGLRAMEPQRDDATPADVKDEMNRVMSEAERLAAARAQAGNPARFGDRKGTALEDEAEPQSAPIPISLDDTKRALWDVMNEDKWRDPFLVVHQARLDARATYSELYAHSKPTRLRQGAKGRRGDPFNLQAGNEKKMLQDPWLDYYTYGWGLNRQLIHNLDSDAKTVYVTGQDGPAVKDPVTGGIDFTREKKAARGLRFNGPRFYKLGIDEDRARQGHPGEDPAA